MGADFEMLRQKMVDNQIRTVDVTRHALLEAFLTVPREKFVPEGQQGLAYVERSFVVAEGIDGQPPRYLAEPARLAKLLQLADISGGDAVLVIGATTGYSAALIAKMATSVIALESLPNLAAQAQSNLADLDVDNVVVVEGALEKGCPAEAPYNVIVIEGAVDFVPPEILAQLHEGGRLVTVEGRGNSAIARLYMKEDGVISARRGFNLALDVLPGFIKKPDFVF